MNEEPHHLTPVGDEALEARIIAWVLGEASPFEAAELENICEQNPEWRVFQRRMLATHELLGEATTVNAAEDWKMPSEKRGKLDALIGAVEVFIPTTAVKKPRSNAIGLAATLVVSTALVGGFAVSGAKCSKSSDIVAFHETKQVSPQVAASQAPSDMGQFFRTESRPAPSAPSAKMNAAASASNLEIPVPEMNIPQPTTDFGNDGDFGDGWGSSGEGEGGGGSASSRTDYYDSKVESGKAQQEGKGQSITKSGAASTIEVIREFDTPTEYEPPELPNALGNNVNGRERESTAGSDDPFAPHEGLAAGGEGGGRGMQIDGDPFAASEPQGSVITDSKAKVFASQSASAAAVDVPADPFSDGNQPEAAALRYRGAPAKEEATRLAEGERVPTLGEIPQLGRLFQEKPSAPAAPASESAPVIPGAQRGVALEKHVMGYAKNLEGGEAASALGDAPLIDSSKESVHFNGRNFNMQQAEGYYELGKLNDAKKSYEQALRENAYDKEARKGLEKVAIAESDYYRSAYDHTRAQLLTDVDKAWELAIPAEKSKAVDPLVSELSPASDPSSLAKDADKDSYAWWSGDENQKAKTTSGPPVTIAGNKATADKDIRQEVDEEQTKALEELEDIKGFLSKPNLKAYSAQKAPLTLPEIFASQEPYSTFSLRVSDNAFRIAQAAMAQNQRPAAESVRVEEFYNAFDYGDPVPTAKEPVAASMEQAAHPILPQRNLLRIGLRTAAAGRGAGQPLHLTLLVDQSGSMSRGDRSDALLASVKELSTLLNAQDQISVIGFSRTPRLLAEKVPGDQHARLIELLARTPSDGGTNLEEALKLGEVVAKRNHLVGAQNRLLLLTDGAANLGNADPDRLAAWVKTLRQQNIAFDIAGIGTDGLNDPLLVEIARNGNGRYYVMNNATHAKQQFATQLAGAFRPAAENVKVQVQFNPQRVGKYQLIGFEKDRLRTEDFRNDKVDAAEMAAAEAGQALYQIELLPEGTGDVGEVSVRFRDVATQQMVERKWTIRYDPTTPAFDNATPTMQLAGLAMLSAQKLQGGAAAPMIRFSEMQEPLRNVRDEFSSNQRVGELLEMIRKLND
jgi:Mg-chelatase subunit ChlD